MTNFAFVRTLFAGTAIVVLTGVIVALTVSFKVNLFSLSSEVTSNGKTNNYTYPTCREDLKMVRSVLFGEESSDDDVVVVASDMDLEGNENIAQLVRYSLDFVVGTQECRSAILSFMCLLLFPLRDGNGTIYRPSREDCHVITMDTCKDEWENMLGLPQVGWQIFSPDCGNLSNDTGQTILQWSSRSELSTGLLLAERVNCSEDFILINGTCFPRCDKWTGCLGSGAIVIDAIKTLSSVGTIAVNVATLIVSYFERAKMFTFPFVLILHLTTYIMLQSIVTVISTVDHGELYCSSSNLLEALQSPTKFCSAVHIIDLYTNLTSGIWWLSYVIILLWHIEFPFQARQYKANGYNKYIYAAILLSSQMVAVISAVTYTVLGGGDGTYGFDPAKCLPNRADVLFYAHVLPVNALFIAQIVLIILAIKTLIEHRKSKIDPSNNIITADRKLLIVMCHNLFFCIVTIIAIWIDIRPNDQLAKNVYKFLSCHSAGQGSCDVEMSACEDLVTSVFNLFYSLMYGTIPVVLLYLVIPSRWFKCCARRQSSTGITS